MRTTARHPLHPSRPRARLALVLSALFAALLAAAA